MRALIQRVIRASVTVASKEIGRIERGLVVFVGVTLSDGASDVDFLANKIANLRIFEDEEGRFNRSALDIHSEVMVVSQFTLYADTSRGRRPDFLAAAKPEQAEPLVEALTSSLESFGLGVTRGKFQAKMLVEIHNDGPVTIWLDSKARSEKQMAKTP